MATLKTTYLLGAGASCKALPILSGICNRMREQINFLGTTNGIESKLQDVYVEELNWLINTSSQHSTVDTLARKYFLNNSMDKLYRLKNCLATFLTIEQIRNDVDSRYDTFFANLLESSSKMPDSLKILSWNYDSQLEMGYSKFLRDDNSYPSENNLKVLHKFADNYFDSEKFSVLKLNGSARCYSNDYSKRELLYKDFLFEDPNSSSINRILERFDSFRNALSGYVMGISFAWEKEPYTKEGENIIELAKRATQNTDILVIVGYSIPFFNRHIDRELIANMESLKRVYVQDIKPDSVIEKFMSIRTDFSSNNLIGIKNCEEFYLPFEL